MTATTWVAVYGAIVATLSLGWHIYRHLSDKGRLTVNCSVKQLLLGREPDPCAHVLVWKVVNVGRKPVWLGSFGGGFKDGDNFWLESHGTLPRELKPGESHSEYLDSLEKLAGELDTLWVDDATDRRYRARHSQVRQVNEDLRTLQRAK